MSRKENESRTFYTLLPWCTAASLQEHCFRVSRCSPGRMAALPGALKGAVEPPGSRIPALKHPLKWVKKGCGFRSVTKDRASY